jgi:hypothetical protein
MLPDDIHDVNDWYLATATAARRAEMLLAATVDVAAPSLAEDNTDSKGATGGFLSYKIVYSQL